MKADMVINSLFRHRNLLSDLLSLESCYVKEIEAKDEKDFYKMLHASDADTVCFENHWPYIIQSTRNMGFVYKKNKTRIYFYFRNRMNYTELVIVNMFGSEKIKILSLFKKCAIANKIHLCIKNIPTDSLAYWEKLGYCEKKEKWSQYSKKDDNSFPECIYDLETIALSYLPIEPGKIRTCRASHTNKLRQYLKSRSIKVIKYIPELHRNLVHELLIENANFLQNKGVDSKQNVIDAHMFVFNDEILYQERLVHVENDTFLGFNYITVVNNVAFGDALIHENASDLMRFLVWQGFNYLYNKLNRNRKYYVTMQGSERFGQYSWKKGFSPLREISKTHLTLTDEAEID